MGPIAYSPLPAPPAIKRRAAGGFWRRIRPPIILSIRSILGSITPQFSALRYPSRFASSICVSSSLGEPRATWRKLANYFFAAPSAILLGILAAALLIWPAGPNCSSPGKLPVISQIIVTGSIDNFHTSSFLRGFPVPSPPAFRLTVFCLPAQRCACAPRPEARPSAPPRQCRRARGIDGSVR